MSQVIKVAITGAAGQIAYSLLFRIASGEVFGPKQKVALHLLEVEQAQDALKGVVMELQDCAFENLVDVQIGSDPFEVFDGVHWALLVGAKPRGPGMERKDLLQDNGAIFIKQGQALNDKADPNVKVLVVGNPCNTNCLICSHHAPDLPKSNFYAMTRLDQNRLSSQLAQKAGVAISDTSHGLIWGNHSATQVPDFYQAKINEKACLDVINDESFLQNEMIPIIQKRGAAIIQARGKSSAASAANAVIDTVKDIYNGTAQGSWSSAGVYSQGNPYGIDENLIFSFPLEFQNQKHRIVEGLEWNAFIREKIKESEAELIEEREQVLDLISVT